MWTKLDGSCTESLLMAKLAPLQYKGETSRQEFAGATKAARLKCWILEHAGLKFLEFFHCLDSLIVQYMIRKDSYCFGTYAGLRVAEIQQKTDVDKWFPFESAENIADILTKRCEDQRYAKLNLAAWTLMAIVMFKPKLSYCPCLKSHLLSLIQ